LFEDGKANFGMFGTLLMFVRANKSDEIKIMVGEWMDGMDLLVRSMIY